jgi:hypothetical protein
MTLRPSTATLAALLLLVAAFAGCFVDADLTRRQREPDITAMRAMAAKLDLTDLALFTEARYTRHPSQADLHSAFQDHPLALEHFPSGSLIVPQYDRLVRETATPD